LVGTTRKTSRAIPIASSQRRADVMTTAWKLRCSGLNGSSEIARSICSIAAEARPTIVR
jgi:hypothetical protein